MQNQIPRILITGASGFIGSHLVEAALARGWDVYAGVRLSSSRVALQDKRIKFFPFNFDNPDELKTDLHEFASIKGGFHYVIHNAGITKPKNPGQFFEGNALFTRDFATAVLKSQPELRKFVYMSSMAALGPGDSVSFEPITEVKQPKPITPYGISKLKAEQFLSEIHGLPHVSMRPSAVYGPRDIKLIKRLVNLFKNGIEVRLGSADQRLSFVHVQDLAVATLSACTTITKDNAFNISDGGIYSQSELNNAIKSVLGVRTIPIRIPAKMLIGVGYVLFKALSAMGQQVHLSHYKMREITAKNWIVDIRLAREQLNFQPEYNLHTGIAQTLSEMG